MSKPSRRDFLKVVTSYLVGITSALGLAGVGYYLSYDNSPRRKTEFDLGAADLFLPGSRTRIDEIPALIVRDQAGFSVLSLQCTHLGCTIQDAKTGFLCPCHGSQYDSHGDVIRGPAKLPLPRLSAEINAQGNLVVRTE